MTLFKLNEAVTEEHNITLEELYRLPFYEYIYYIDIINEKNEKRKREHDKEEKKTLKQQKIKQPTTKQPKFQPLKTPKIKLPSHLKF